ncbi:hypothetical protein [Streptomyces sp. t39]|uniref:hypothetical protein n=1 Tax=Streptomyces sp. t39 TaxID=1828156 RepID=UPI001650C382|nr:hypothetical protein [Streptomyces sp. t39]
MAHTYTATVMVTDYYCEAEPASEDMQDILNVAFKHFDGHVATVTGDVTIAEES